MKGPIGGNEKSSWEEHINHICLKLSAGIGAVRRIKAFVPFSTLKTLCKATVQLYFDYCSPLWNNCGTGLKNRLQKFQNRAVRVVYGANYDTQSAVLVENLRWEPLEERQNYLKAVFMFKILNGHTDPNLKELFETNHDSVCPYNLRNTQTDFALPSPKKDLGKRFLITWEHHYGIIFPGRKKFQNHSVLLKQF